jgi:hypothetical protein
MRNRKHARSLALFGLLAGLFLITSTASVSAAAKKPVDDMGVGTVLDFTIGVPGKTGCLVCHGDPKLKNVKSGRALFISESEMMSSVHKELACTKCHTDFSAVNAAQSHQGITGDPRKVAGLACKNCHQHATQLKIYDTSVHGRKALGGDPDAATCGDCHGSHDIKSFKKNKAYKQEFKMKAAEVCGGCHKDHLDSYDDYYHGAAFKTGAPNAPACWDCHGTHSILPAKDAESKIGDKNLAKTCGSCHPDSKAGFTGFAEMIHDRQTVMKKNLVIKYKNKLVSWIKKTF